MTAYYCIQTHQGKESTVESKLKDMGYIVYYPQKLKDRRLKRKIGTLEPLFPSYLFVQMEFGVDDFVPIKQERYVRRVISNTVQDGCRYPSPVPQSVIIGLMASEDELGIHSNFKSDYVIGDEVRVSTGPLKDYTGTIQRIIDSKDGMERCVLMLSTLMEVNLEVSQIEPMS